MKTTFVFVGFLLLASAVSQRHEVPRPKGVIYGVATGQDGQPAKGIVLTACPLGVPLGTVLPLTKTNDAGEYRFENLPWWGRYTVYAEDEEAGYSSFSTGPAGDGQPAEVVLTPEHREAKFNVRLPPKAGFLQIHLTNEQTGAVIWGMDISLMPKEHPESPLFTMGSSSNKVVLVPPNKDLLLHVTSWGFREWDESVGRGKPLHLSSGARLTLDVQLEPSDYATHCPDPRLQRAVIGGNTIEGSVRLRHEPLKFAQLQLFFLNGKTAWLGTTDKDSRFHIRDLEPDTYRLDVQGWGTTMVRISPDLNKLSNGQTLSYSVQLMDDECIGTTVTN
jgi:hypothetical protein